MGEKYTKAQRAKIIELRRQARTIGLIVTKGVRCRQTGQVGFMLIDKKTNRILEGNSDGLFSLDYNALAQAVRYRIENVSALDQRPDTFS